MLVFLSGSSTPKSIENYNAETFGFIIEMIGSLGISVVDTQI